MFYVSTPSSRTKRTLQTALFHHNLLTDEPFQGVLSVPFHLGKFEQLSTMLVADLSKEEMELTRCRLMPSGTKPSPADLMQSQSLAGFFTGIRGQWLAAMIRQQRLITHFQPIVSCRDPQQVFAYECLLRGLQADGQIATPGQLYETAVALNQLSVLDHAAKMTHIQSAARSGKETNFFINFNPAATQDLDDCLERTFQAVLASGIPAHRLTFEVIESHQIKDPDPLLQILDIYRQRGFRVALDDIGAGYNSLNLMTLIKPDFIKLDMHLMHRVDQDPYKARVAAKLLELAKDLNVATVVEGVEHEAEWRWAMDNGADYGQGYLFARPAAEPPEPQFHPEQENGRAMEEEPVRLSIEMPLTDGRIPLERAV